MFTHPDDENQGTFSEIQGNAFVGDFSSAAPENRPFWVRITAARGVKVFNLDGSDGTKSFYGWEAVQPTIAGGFTTLDGGRVGRVFPEEAQEASPTTDPENPLYDPSTLGVFWPAYEANQVEVPIYSYALIRRAYFDENFSWTYLVMWWSSPQDSAAPTPNGPALGYGGGSGTPGLTSTVINTFGPNKIVEHLGPGGGIHYGRTGGRQVPLNPKIDKINNANNGVPAPPIKYNQNISQILNSNVTLSTTGVPPSSSPIELSTNNDGIPTDYSIGNEVNPFPKVQLIPVELSIGTQKVPSNSTTINTSTGTINLIPPTFSKGVPNSTLTPIPPTTFTIQTQIPGTNPVTGAPVTGTGQTLNVVTITQNPTPQANGQPPPPEFTFGSNTVLGLPSVVTQPTINTATVTGTLNNYPPTSYNGIVPLKTSGGAVTVTGIQKPPFLPALPGTTTYFNILNTGPDTITFSNLSVGSLPGNRLLSPTGSNLTLQANGTQSLFYDYSINGGAGGWRLAVSTAISGGGISGSGTLNTLAKFTGATSIGDSQTTDDGINIVAGNASQLTNYTVNADVGGGYIKVTNPNDGILMGAGSSITPNMVGVYLATTLIPLVQLDYTTSTLYVGSSTFPNVFPASTTDAASLNLPPGTAPTTPVDGDFWTTSTNAYAQINGVTITLGSPTVKEVDGSPSYAGSGTILFDQTQGFSLSQPAANQAQVTMLDASLTQPGVVSASGSQTFGGVKHFDKHIVVDSEYIQLNSSGTLYPCYVYSGLYTAMNGLQLQSSNSGGSHFINATMEFANLRFAIQGDSSTDQTKYSVWSVSDAAIVDGGTSTTGGLKFVGGVYISGSSTGLKANTGTPSIAANAAAGTGATASISGDDNSGQITLNTGSVVGLGAGSLLTVTYGTAFSSTRYPTFSPANANSASAGLLAYTSSPTTTTFDISATAALTQSVTYLWNYKVIGN